MKWQIRWNDNSEVEIPKTAINLKKAVSIAKGMDQRFRLGNKNEDSYYCAITGIIIEKLNDKQFN